MFKISSIPEQAKIVKGLHLKEFFFLVYISRSYKKFRIMLLHIRLFKYLVYLNAWILKNFILLWFILFYQKIYLYI